MKLAFPALAALAFVATPVLAQDPAEPGLSIELNTAQTTDATCTLTFVVINGHSTAIDKLIYETVLFDSTGQVNRLTLFDFAKLPPALPRVRQFALAGTPCDMLGRVLFNGVNTCSAADEAACHSPLTATSRTDIEVLG